MIITGLEIYKYHNNNKLKKLWSRKEGTVGITVYKRHRNTVYLDVTWSLNSSSMSDFSETSTYGRGVNSGCF